MKLSKVTDVARGLTNGDQEDLTISPFELEYRCLANLFAFAAWLDEDALTARGGDAVEPMPQVMFVPVVANRAEVIVPALPTLPSKHQSSSSSSLLSLIIIYDKHPFPSFYACHTLWLNILQWL